jgi:hypothetical protein
MNNLYTLPIRDSFPSPYWVVGISIDEEEGFVNVHPQALREADYADAIDHAMDTAKALYPNSNIEFLSIKEYN